MKQLLTKICLNLPTRRDNTCCYFAGFVLFPDGSVIQCWVASRSPVPPRIGVGEMAGEGEEVMTPKQYCATLW